jgi:hypothetical protein
MFTTIQREEVPIFIDPISRTHMTIHLDTALQNPRLLGAALGPPDTWKAWLAILKATSGQTLDAEIPIHSGRDVL